MRLRVVIPIVNSGPPPTVLAPGLGVRTGRLSPADKGVNMKLTGGPLGEGAVNFNEGRNDLFSCPDVILAAAAFSVLNDFSLLNDFSRPQ